MDVGIVQGGTTMDGVIMPVIQPGTEEYRVIGE